MKRMLIKCRDCGAAYKQIGGLPTQMSDIAIGAGTSSYVPVAGPAQRWSYEEAFARNLGLISVEEQKRLQNSRVAIVGMGGVGGIHLETLARLGVGQFTIADPDVFEVANTNRQRGATCSAIGRRKADVMAEIARDINPQAEIRVFTDPIGPENAVDFLRGADLFVDGVDFFEIEVRRLLFRLAAHQEISAITAGPVGFSTAWLTFAPDGMSFDRYFDLSDEMTDLEKLVAFFVGLAPKATQAAYMDLKYFDVAARTGPSASTACHLAGGVLGCEAVKILTGKARVRPAPYYYQFDPFVGRLAHGRLPGGNRHPPQQLKRWFLVKHLQDAGENSTDIRKNNGQ